MSVRREDAASKPDEVPTGSSWFPATPAKPGSSDRQQICTDWGETERLGQASSSDVPACYTSMSLNNTSRGVNNWPAGMASNSHVYEENLISFESWLAGEGANSHVYGRNSSAYDGFSINDSGQWANMSFGNLLRAVGKTGPMENLVDSSSSCFGPQFGGSTVEDPLGGTGFSGTSRTYFHPSVGSSQLAMSSFDQGTVLGANFGAEMGIPNTVMDTSSILSRHLLDLNAPPRTTTDAALRTSIGHQFEPITPQKSNGGEYGQVSAINNSSTDEAPFTGENSKIACNREMQLHEKKEKSHILNEQLCEVTSTQLQENHKPDKGGTEEADLLKTPQQKARRKKHRPKVIIEGKTKNNPKPSPRKNSGPPETPRVKRKYVRKNGVNSPLGGADNGTDSENKTPSFTETTVEKKQGRIKGINKSEETDKETTETTEIQARRYSLRSSRRSLNFNDDPVIDGVSRNCPSSHCERELQEENSNVKDQPETENCTQETEEMKEKHMVTSHVRTRSVNEIQEDFQSRAEQNPQSSLPPINKDTLKESDILTDQTVSTRVKCQIVFSDVTHDKEANIVQVSMNSDGQRTPRSISDSIGSDTCLTPEKKVSGLKRQNTDTTSEAAPQPRNEAGVMYNSLQAYLSVFTQNADNGTPGLYFPTIYKKKRTEKVYSTATSSMQMTANSHNGVKFETHTLRNSCGSMFTATTNQGFYGARSVVNNLLTTNHAAGGSQNGRQVFQDLLALGPTDRIKRKRSKGPTRQRNLAPLLEKCEQWPKPRGRPATISRTEKKIEFLGEPLTCIEALVVDTRPAMATKKRSKRSMSINSTGQTLYDHQNFAGTSMGPPLALTWKTMSPVESITEKLNRLDLNAKSSTLRQKYNAFMPYRSSYEERFALVPFQTSGAVVPFDPVRRRKPRPKVDLDDETTRVWKLLLENINSEGIDGTNEENTKWWEEERRVFNGRAESFIARMHLVQGDRHFSPWKGSVLDSVIGVFLTQNVSDHLSSSAFMSLAARFPVRPNSEELHYERPVCEINEPEICELDSDGTFVLTKEILNEVVCCEDTTKLQEFEYDRIREVNSMKPSQNASGDDSSLRDQSTDTSSPSPVISCEIIANRSVSSEDGKDTEDTLSSQAPEISSQDSVTSPILPATGKSDSCLPSTPEEEPTAGVKPNWLTSSTSFVKLLEMTGTVLNGAYREGNDKRKSDEGQYAPSESLACSLQNEDHLDNSTVPDKAIASCSPSPLCHVPNLRAQSREYDLSQKNSKFSDSSSDKEIYTTEISGLSSESASGLTCQKSTDISSRVQKLSSSIACSSSNEQIEINQKKVDKQRGQAPPHNKMQGGSEKPNYQQHLMDATATGSSCNIDNSKEHKEVNSNKPELGNHPQKTGNGPKSVGQRKSKEKENPVDWDQLRKQAEFGGRKRERTNRTLDSVDWEAIRCADVNEIAQTIKERGMNNMLAERIKDFLNRLVREHGSIDMEWLRDVPPDKAKEYLLSIRGLGLKSVECVRLLTLHHLAFPVDTNVGRIAVRLGWVPLQPLPESLQLHLLELYPVLESIQKYLWPRLCKLDQKTLYELHYQMITFGKVFCTKSRPNCNACPMRGECRHFASAYASARLSLPAPQDKSIVIATGDRKAGQTPIKRRETLQLSFAQTDDRMNPKSGVTNYLPIIEELKTPEPIIEVPATPEPDYAEASECDIESAFGEDPDEIPTIHLNMEEFTHNLQTIMQQNTELQEGEVSKALVALTSEAASIPVPKLKNVSRLRTEHHVYELPDSHPLLDGLDKREPDDPCPYLLAIWTPGETMDSIEPPETRCSSQGLEKLCTDETCLSCNSIREAKSQTVRGTLLIPCRTAMRGSFPLNGTYFQVNEVFSDHESSLCPMDIPRKFLWNLPRRTVYFGTSIPSIFKGLSTEGIQYCFWRGFVCVRGFDRKTRAPRPLIARLHFPASKLAKGKGKVDEN